MWQIQILLLELSGVFSPSILDLWMVESLDVEPTDTEG